LLVIPESLALTDTQSPASAAAILIPESLFAADGLNVLFAPGGVVLNQSVAEALAITDTLFIPVSQHFLPISEFIALQDARIFARAFHIPDIFIVGDHWIFQGTAFVSIVDFVYPLSVIVEAVPSLLTTVQAATSLLAMQDVQYKFVDTDDQFNEMSVNDVDKKLVTIEDYARG